MNPASKDIATFLANETALGLTLATDLFYSRIPDSPNDCVTIMDNAGDPPLLGLKKFDSNYHYSSVSVYVRNIKYSEGWDVINGIVQFLHGQGNLTIGGSFYSLIKAMSDPHVLVYDDNNRVIFLVNFEVQRRNS